MYSSISVCCAWIELFGCLCSLLTGLLVVPNLKPPLEALSSNLVTDVYPTHYNLNNGTAFNISCISTHTSNAFTVFFYKDGAVISDRDLVDIKLVETDDSFMQKTLQMQFLNFQPVHDGVYHCFANTSDTNENTASDLYLYGSGEENCIYSHSMHY